MKKEILNQIKQLKKENTKALNQILENNRKTRAWDYVWKGLDIPEKLDLSLLEKGKRYTTFYKNKKPGWESYKEGEGYKQFIVDDKGKGIEIHYICKRVLVDKSPDDWGDDYYTGIGTRKEVEGRWDSELRMIIGSVKKVENIPIPENTNFIFIPKFKNPHNIKEISTPVAELKRLENLEKAVSKLPEDFDTDKLQVEINAYEEDEYKATLKIYFSKAFKYRIDIDEYYADTDEAGDIPDEIHKNVEIAKRAGDKALTLLNQGILPDLKEIAKEEMKKIKTEEERKKIIEIGWEYADNNVVDGLRAERDRKNKEANKIIW